MDNKKIDAIYEELIEEIDPKIDDISYVVRYKLVDLPYDDYKNCYDIIIKRLTKHYISELI
jgi:hypothetical protein